jgi:FkbM family methyltransferase
MRIFRREIKLSEIISKGIAFGKAAARIVRTFKGSGLILRSYIKGNSGAVRSLTLRDGTTIHLSDHPDDVITVFVIFGRKDYGDIPKGGVVVDIGANIGTFTLYAAMNGASKVLSIEPNSRAFNVLQTNAQTNKLSGKVVPIRAAVTDHDGDTVFIPVSSSPYNAITSERGASDAVEAVETVTLKGLAAQYNLDRIDLLKVDCEGAEFTIIPSIPSDLLKRIRCIRLEYQDKDVTIITDYLQKHSFRIVRHDRDERFNAGMLWLERT